MKQITILLFTLLVITFLEVSSQTFTHEFIETARTTKLNGYIRDIAIGPDGTIFLANYYGGLRAYTYDGSSFTNTAHIDDGGFAEGVAVSSEGTIFLANDYDGLRAYTYDGSSFTNTDHIDDGDYGSGVAVTVANGYIYLANMQDGLRVYIYDESLRSFERIAHIYDGGWAEDVAIGSDSTIYLANGSDGLRAYCQSGYYGIIITNIAHIDDAGEARGVAISSDGTIFLANGPDGLRSYTCEGSSFTNTAEIDNVSAHEVSVSSDGTIFVGCSDGLRAYVYEGNSLTNIAHINDGSSRAIEIADDGTIFHANREGVLITYEYSLITSVKATDIPKSYSLYQNYPNPFNPSTTIKYSIPKQSNVTIKVYDVLGSEVATLIDKEQPKGNYEIEFDGTDLTSGIYFYRLQAGDFVETKKMILIK